MKPTEHMIDELMDIAYQQDENKQTTQECLEEMA